MSLFACRHCGHNVDHHNLIEGCVHCKCAATPGEAAPRTEAEDRAPILSVTTARQEWQIKPPSTEASLRQTLHDATVALSAAQHRRDMAEEALDAFMGKRPPTAKETQS